MSQNLCESPMPFDVVLEDKETLYRILFWSSRALVSPFCLDNECQNVSDKEKQKFIYYSAEYIALGSFSSNYQKFRSFSGYENLYEIKPSDQLRLMGGFHESDFIIVHCFRKKSKETPKQEIDTALDRWKRCCKEIKDKGKP